MLDAWVNLASKSRKYKIIMDSEGSYFLSEGGIFDYPKLVPRKFYLNFDPPQIGYHYTRTSKESHKHLFLV